MTNRDVLQLNRALQLLENQPNERGEMVPTFFFFGKGSYAISRNLSKTESIGKHLEKTRVKLVTPLIQQIKDRQDTQEKKDAVKGIDQSEPEYKTFMDAWIPILSEESDFKPHMLSVEDLHLERNNIAPSLINLLEPLLLSEEPAKTPAPSGLA